MGTALRYSLLWASTVFVSSCGSLLPSERAEVQSLFVDYLDAELRYSQAQPGSTTRSQLFGLGFDPLTQGNGRMLSFIDVRLMFIQPNIPIDYLPGGLVQCLEAKDRCIGYAFDFSKTDTQRVGSFWADVFNFRKKRELQGWSFKAVFVFVNDVLVHKVSNGEPNIHRLEDKKNPLGPLQGAGEYFSDKLR
ncbi:TPA: hypothetical protein L4605_000099 [Pseudomonas aeruginosa]|uniref:hypothetical protein n=1 Tax=Pseudomonas aeruginosa TaxID=287 RepID=UPI001CBD9D26|nr:hypothetical protein [Pseudomonas aeruginosa]HBO2995844.1 hypothetical protein [Pseudomonas aeruginosa]HBO5652396.1 hypothetical protein [Pseudomonas aeruginosa]HCI1864286.1 hypothetical protein [Pseudomonas aeruginosa]HCI2648951.1 hypothetical protein [Pseudomonas aeruginosa]